MSDFDSLTLALEAWFDMPWGALPEPLRARAAQELRHSRWDKMSLEERRSAALQVDYELDPATEQQRREWSTVFQRMGELEAELERQRPTMGVSLVESTNDSGPLKRVRDQIQRMKTGERRSRNNYYPQRKTADKAAEPGRYMAYPKAVEALRQRLGATPEEVAAWVFMGEDAGGLSAYMNVTELDPPPRFGFALLAFVGNASGDSDFVAPLMGCWFKSVDVVRFEPVDRFITGQVLVERWGSIPGVKVEPFIQAKIRESRLVDLHPIYGGTQAGGLGGAHLPAMTEGLFRLGDVEAIEAEDFAASWTPDQLPGKNPVDHATETASTNGGLQTAEPRLAMIRELQCLQPDELTITFVGDRFEQGLAANCMLEISARGRSRRVSLADLDLVDRRKGELNSQGALLIGMRKGLRLPRSEANAKKVSRLRGALKLHLGIDEPFVNLGSPAGWEPRFNIEDRRGAADDRAQAQAERMTRSLDQAPDIGVADASDGRLDRHMDMEDDVAAQWLKEHDPDQPG